MLRGGGWAWEVGGGERGVRNKIQPSGTYYIEQPAKQIQPTHLRVLVDKVERVGDVVVAQGAPPPPPPPQSLIEISPACTCR
jgi:hypothetical protein